MACNPLPNEQADTGFGRFNLAAKDPHDLLSARWAPPDKRFDVPQSGAALPTSRGRTIRVAREVASW